MPLYYINRNKDEKGLNEVHKFGCSELAKAYSVQELGVFPDGIAAVIHAKSIGWTYADGCKFCCPEAHNG